MTDKNIAKKEKAIELLKEMDIYAPYIKGFRRASARKAWYASLNASAGIGQIRSPNSTKK